MRNLNWETCHPTQLGTLLLDSRFPENMAGAMTIDQAYEKLSPELTLTADHLDNLECNSAERRQQVRPKVGVKKAVV